MGSFSGSKVSVSWRGDDNIATGTPAEKPRRQRQHDENECMSGDTYARMVRTTTMEILLLQAPAQGQHTDEKMVWVEWESNTTFREFGMALA